MKPRALGTLLCCLLGSGVIILRVTIDCSWPAAYLKDLGRNWKLLVIRRQIARIQYVCQLPRARAFALGVRSTRLTHGTHSTRLSVARHAERGHNLPGRKSRLDSISWLIQAADPIIAIPQRASSHLSYLRRYTGQQHTNRRRMYSLDGKINTKEMKRERPRLAGAAARLQQAFALFVKTSQFEITF